MHKLGDQVGTENRSRLNKLNLGMSKSDILDLMGTGTYTITEDEPYIIIPSTLTLSNPYNIETFQGASGKIYEVILYYAGIKKRDGVVTDDELIPIVLEDEKLVGWGNRFFEEVRKVEIRVR